jgi:adenine-specific DNA-methyltransferase
MGTRYIGSKLRISDLIIDIAGPPAGSGRFIDAFCGTGAVSHAASDKGWDILANDFLKSAGVMAGAGLIQSEQVSFENLGGYKSTVSKLNALAPQPGFFHKEYSPASMKHVGLERRYFTEINAAKIDAIRTQIANWKIASEISDVEENLLLGDLVIAVNGVANISGTYGCFLSTWTASSKKNFEMKPRILSTSKSSWEIQNVDVFNLAAKEDDLVYFDPPYTKRQYAAYYHLLETLVIGDKPVVSGVTGLRPWQDRSSIFCYKKKALDGLVRLIDETPCRRILLSYSNEGHVTQGDLEIELSKIGHLEVHQVNTIGRYRPNSSASSAGGSVNEFVIEIQKSSALTALSRK